MIDVFLVATAIEIYLGLFLALYLMIRIVISDYKAWKRNKEEKERCRQMEDKFKNRKLTD